ncbi:cytochrome c oxidase subunit 3 [Dermatobacter hominis]|uniref:cytochrome c oxidase subunit 3 n=1 Tax=Dermatobacter hominis TaxID=2884263 RepID=UPI001D12B790|nr:heme-copper oxidase subunit III [Dermatobacter hominis]UDY34158.1 heme-copper oxidase subunit III [Dermatobacter hominis]
MLTSTGRSGPAPINVGAVVWLSSELMFFAALGAAALSLEGASPTGWPPPGAELNIPLAALLTVVLVSSSFVIHGAVGALERGDVRRFRRLLLATAVMGAVFVSGQAWEWSELGFGVTSNAFGTAFYTITGFHGLHLMAGLVAIGVVLGRSAAAGFDSSRTPSAQVLAYYWHFVDVVWIGVFVLLYLSP